MQIKPRPEWEKKIFYQIDINLSEKIRKKLLKKAKKKILKDKPELLNYIINHILKEYMDNIKPKRRIITERIT